MTIFCNDREFQIEETILSAVLIELGYQNATIATAVNGDLIPKTERDEFLIKSGDRIDVVAPMQGG